MQADPQGVDALIPKCDCLETCSQRPTLHKPGCPREAVLVALLGQAVDALDLATDALAVGAKMPERAVLTAKLRAATKDLRVAVGDAIGGDDGD
jgi:hypothetical protein